MPRSLWSGAIAFGLVNIPVKMYSAVQAKDVHFHQLHDEDGVRIQQKRICPAHEQEVPYEHIVKGYEVSRGRYVIVRPEELKALDPEATGTIDIQQFVDQRQIDPLHFEHSYYLGPDRGAAKAYALLQAAMDKAGKVAIGRVVLRTRQYLVLLRPLAGLLAMETLYYADEILPPADIEGPGRVQLVDAEMAMAHQLIEALSGDFVPGRWRDDYRDRVLELVRKKAEGEEIVAAAQVPRAVPVLDLAAALRASLERTRDAGIEAAAKKEDPVAPPRESTAAPSRSRSASRRGRRAS